MKFIPQKIPDVILIKPTLLEDSRGYFVESFRQDLFEIAVGSKIDFIQENESKSKKGVLRGLHFQKTRPQGKLVRVVSGEVYDVAVDIRKDSQTFWRWHGVILSESNKRQFWVPPGFAHGFVVLSEIADFEYKCTDYYDPSDEGSIFWNDADLDIKWPVKNPLVSEKDAAADKFSSIRQ